MHALLLFLLAPACRNTKDAGDTAVAVVDNDGDGVPSDQDCDDENPDVGPDFVEICDGLDNDCDGEIDNAAGDLWYEDADGDGFGDPDEVQQSCEGSGGYVADSSDCNDTLAQINPEADELCNGLDDNCDGSVDEDAAVDAQTWYTDADGDGYGDLDAAVTQCDAPSGAVLEGGDCDDSAAEINPAALEICNGVDDNCIEGTDEDSAVDALTWYADTDLDGFGDPSNTRSSCEAPSGYGSDSSDCDDTQAAVNPEAEEICNSVDDDCDGVVDPDTSSDALTWFEDTDADGYGHPSRDTQACAQPSGYVADDQDCKPYDGAINPGATEVCDGSDNDCDGDTDEGVLSTWYLDYDADGYGDDSSAVQACAAPTARYIAANGDCDDTDTAYNPGATAGCDGEDYDCDGLVDSDADLDGYADASCGGDDCVDSDATIYPDTSGDCALGTSCLDILTKGYGTSDGSYSIDPDGYGAGEDPETVYCEMSLDGGGWTLISISASGSGLTATNILDDSAFGSPDFSADYKALAFSTMDFSDLMFDDGSLYAVYQGVGSGSQSFYDFVSGLSTNICGSTTTTKYSLSAGTFTGADLCETTLYFNAIDEDGGHNSTCDPNAEYSSNATGPGWSTSNNNGCPHDDANSASFLSPSARLPWDTAATLNMYAR